MFLLEQAGSFSLRNSLFEFALSVFFLLDHTLNDLSVVYDSFERADGGTRRQREYIFDVSSELSCGAVVLNHVCDSVNVKYFIVTARLDEWVLVSQGTPGGDDSSDIVMRHWLTRIEEMEGRKELEYISAASGPFLCVQGFDADCRATSIRSAL